jgi:Tannase and feruloyl esterase
MGRATVNSFARFFVLPQTDHSLNGRSYGLDGDGKEVPVHPIPNSYDRIGLITSWVEKGVAPGLSVTVTAGERGLPMCSYPEFPKYSKGPPEEASSCSCAWN